jgi:hypothetical protein
MGKTLHTPRSRVQAALRGEELDHRPFTVYRDMIPRGSAERDLRNQGLAIVERVDPYRIETPNVQVLTSETYENGLLTRREWIRTPLGELTRLRTKDPAYQTSKDEWWEVEYPIKNLDDYRIVEFLVSDQVFVPEYDAVRTAQARLGGDGYVIGNVGPLPIRELMYMYLGVEQFAYELLDHRDALLSLHETMCQKDQEMYRVAARAPVEMFIGPARNIDARMFGRDIFETHCLPCMDAFADLAHEEGKVSGSHLDGRIGYIDLIARAHMDVVEAFTPGPISGMTVGEAFAAWPQKVVWANFPSNMHIDSPDEVREATMKILGQATPEYRFLLGVTEDVPEDSWRASFAAISRAVAEHK